MRDKIRKKTIFVVILSMFVLLPVIIQPIKVNARPPNTLEFQSTVDCKIFNASYASCWCFNSEKEIVAMSGYKRIFLISIEDPLSPEQTDSYIFTEYVDFTIRVMAIRNDVLFVGGKEGDAYGNCAIHLFNITDINNITRISYLQESYLGNAPDEIQFIGEDLLLWISEYDIQILNYSNPLGLKREEEINIIDLTGGYANYAGIAHYPGEELFLLKMGHQSTEPIDSGILINYSNITGEGVQYSNINYQPEELFYRSPDWDRIIDNEKRPLMYTLEYIVSLWWVENDSILLTTTFEKDLTQKAVILNQNENSIAKIQPDYCNQLLLLDVNASGIYEKIDYKHPGGEFYSKTPPIKKDEYILTLDMYDYQDDYYNVDMIEVWKIIENEVIDVGIGEVLLKTLLPAGIGVIVITIVLVVVIPKVKKKRNQKEREKLAKIDEEKQQTVEGEKEEEIQEELLFFNENVKTSKKD